MTTREGLTLLLTAVAAFGAGIGVCALQGARAAQAAELAAERQDYVRDSVSAVAAAAVARADSLARLDSLLIAERAPIATAHTTAEHTAAAAVAAADSAIATVPAVTSADVLLPLYRDRLVPALRLDLADVRSELSDAIADRDDALDGWAQTRRRAIALAVMLGQDSLTLRADSVARAKAAAALNGVRSTWHTIDRWAERSAVSAATAAACHAHAVLGCVLGTLESVKQLLTP